MPLLFGVVLLDLIGFGMVVPILPFLSPQLGGDKMDVALILVVYALCSGLCGPLWGRLSDRIGRKPVIMICLAGAALSYVMLGLATELWMVYAARVWGGLMAGNFGVASAMMADVTGPQDRARGMGLIGAAWGMGLVLGPVLGGLLSGDGTSFTLPCVFAGGMSLAAIVAAALFLPESLPPERRRPARVAGAPAMERLLPMLKRTGNRLFILQYALHNSGVSAATYLLPLWVGDMLGWGAREVGVVFGIQGALMVLFQGGLMGRMVRALGEWPLLRLAVGAYLVGLLLAGAASAMGPSVPAMIGPAYLAMTGATLCMPLLNSLLTQRVPLEFRGEVMGATSTSASVGRVAGPLLAGTNLAAFGYTGAWVFSAALVAVYFCWVASNAHRAMHLQEEQ